MFIDNNARYSINDIVPLIKECISEGKKVNMRVTGISMSPLLHNRRDTVVLERADNLKKYDIVLHERKDGTYILHRIIKKKGDVLTIAGDFEIEKEYPVYTSQVIAKVSSFVRNGVYHDANEAFFRFYAIVWVAIFPFRIRALALLQFVRRILRGKK